MNEKQEKINKIRARLSEGNPIFVASEVGWLLDELKKAQEDQDFLQALRNYGVDNWEGYELAVDAVEEIHNPEHKS